MKSLAEFNFDWGGTFAPRYDGYLFATGGVTPSAPAAPAASAPPAAAPSSGSTGAPPAVSPPAAPSGVPPASPAVPTTAAPSPASGDPNAPNLEVIRKSHELVQKFGGPEKVQAAAERYTKMYDTSRDLATQLGYTPESFEAAFGTDPAMIYNHLMTEAQKMADGQRAADGKIDPALRDLINRELSPVKNALQRQMAERGNQITDNEFDSQLKSHTLFKDKSVPPEVRNAIYDRFVNLASGDIKTQKAILNSGDAGGLKVHFDAAVAQYYADVNAYNAWTGRAAAPSGDGGNRNTPAPAPNPNPFANLRLDDIIEGTDDATKALPSMRNFR